MTVDIGDVLMCCILAILGAAFAAEGHEAVGGTLLFLALAFST